MSDPFTKAVEDLYDRILAMSDEEAEVEFANLAKLLEEENSESDEDENPKECGS